MSEPPQKDVDVIIVNWNTKDLLLQCLASIPQNVPEISCQVIVVDNASKDGSAEMVRREFPAFRLLESGGNIGFARGNNRANPYIQSRYILYLNPDTVVRPGAIEKMHVFLERNHDVAAVGSRMMFTDGSTQPLGLQWFPNPLTELFAILFLSTGTLKRFKRFLPIHDAERSGYVRKLYGGCLMVRKEVLDRVGYFDERFFMYGEDVDLCRRIIRGGWKLYYLSEAEVVHYCGGASSNASRQFSTLMKCESIGKLMRKYYGVTGEGFYRMALLTGAHARLAVLWAARILRIGETDSAFYSVTGEKYFTIIRWCLNLQKPVIHS